jgi:hypothetical protein
MGAAAIIFLGGVLLIWMTIRRIFWGGIHLPETDRGVRLGVVGTFTLDQRRQLIAVRCGDAEHLVMIGGPNDAS